MRNGGGDGLGRLGGPSWGRDRGLNWDWGYSWRRNWVGNPDWGRHRETSWGWHRGLGLNWDWGRVWGLRPRSRHMLLVKIHHHGLRGRRCGSRSEGGRWTRPLRNRRSTFDIGKDVPEEILRGQLPIRTDSRKEVPKAGRPLFSRQISFQLARCGQRGGQGYR